MPRVDPARVDRAASASAQPPGRNPRPSRPSRCVHDIKRDAPKSETCNDLIFDLYGLLGQSSAPWPPSKMMNKAASTEVPSTFRISRQEGARPEPKQTGDAQEAPNVSSESGNASDQNTNGPSAVSQAAEPSEVEVLSPSYTEELNERSRSFGVHIDPEEHRQGPWAWRSLSLLMCGRF